MLKTIQRVKVPSAGQELFFLRNNKIRSIIVDAVDLRLIVDEEGTYSPKVMAIFGYMEQIGYSSSEGNQKLEGDQLESAHTTKQGVLDWILKNSE